MVTFEEQVLAYLDGTLDEESRGELLHAVSVSPEKREMLDAHIRLRDLFATAHKPESAPLLVQRDLAREIPVLALRLPYLAEESTRRGIAAVGLWSRLNSWVAAVGAVRLGAVVLGTGLVVGGTWYALTRSAQENFAQVTGGSSSIGSSSLNAPSHDSSLANASRTAYTSNSGSIASNSSDAGASRSGGEVGAGPRSGSVAPHHESRTATQATRSSHNGDNGVSARHIAETSTRTSTTAAPSERAHVHSGTQNISSLRVRRSGGSDGSSAANIASAGATSSSPADRSGGSRNRATNHGARQGSPVYGALTDNASSNGGGTGDLESATRHSRIGNNDNVPAGGNLPNSQSPSEAAQHSSIELFASPRDAWVPLHISAAAEGIRIPLEIEEESYTPIHFYTSARARMIMMPKAPLSEHNRAAGFGVDGSSQFAASPELGVAYELSPWVAIGLRGGTTTFGQMQANTYHTTDPRYPLLHKYYSDAAVTSVNAPWAGVTMGYAFNPGSETRFGVTMIGGAAYATKIQPLGMIEGTFVHDISEHFSFAGGISFDVISATPAEAVIDPSVQSSVTLGIQHIGAEPVRVTTNAFGIHVGLKYRP